MLGDVKIIALLMNFTNIMQGYYLCKSNYISRLTRQYCYNIESREKALIMLERVSRLAWLVAFSFSSFFIFSNSRFKASDFKFGVFWIILNTVFNVLTYSPLVLLLFYTFGLWVCVCWLIYNYVI